LDSDKNRYSFHLFEEEKSVKDLISFWKEMNFSGRLRRKDWSLWEEEFQPEITDRLGWVELPERMKERIEGIEVFSREIRKENISTLILIGMGGSSLAPEVFQRIFNQASDFPELILCDSTHPEAVGRLRKAVDLDSTLFIVSSKSGTTLETLSLYHYFWSEVKKEQKEPGQRFIAITDSGTPLMQEARKKGFRKIFNPFPDVGGRFSAFTEFGLVPASLIGVDIRRLLDFEKNISELSLGAALGTVGGKRDKLTFITSKSLKAFPYWLEQLVAESLGKDGKGIIPVIEEPLLGREADCKDRFFIFFSLDREHGEIEKEFATAREMKVAFIDIKLKNRYELGAEIFNWEWAVAAAGSYLKVHPFNQPNVQEAKDFAQSAMKNLSENKADLKDSVETFSIDDDVSLKKAVDEWLSMARKGDYAAVQAYLAPSERTEQKIQNIRESLREKLGIATTMGYGPRFLHSTGQLHKGGPNKGLYLQIVDNPKKDVAVPGKNYSFKSIIKAQSMGDFQALKRKNRRIIRVDLKDQPNKGLSKLKKMIDS
jgi:transaldolase/glucose-6-phosphate isomerase